MASINKRKDKKAGDEWFKAASLEDLVCVICGMNFNEGAYWSGKTHPDGGYVAFCGQCVREGRMGDFVADAMLATGYVHQTAAQIDDALDKTRARAWECAARRLQRTASDLQKEVRRLS